MDWLRRIDWKYLLTSFEGRIGRQSFWTGVVAFIVAGIIASILDGILHTPRFGQSGGLISWIVTIVAIYPAFALYAKRWHDRGKSGWWSLIIIIPLIGAIWLLVELGFLKGTAGANKYGPDPLQG